MTGGDFARKSLQPGFPLASPGTLAKLTVVLNSTVAGDTKVDHRVIPWEPTAPSGGYTGAAVHQKEQIAYRDTTGDFFIRPGRTITVDVIKNVVDNTAPFLSGPRCAGQPFNTTEVYYYLYSR